MKIRCSTCNSSLIILEVKKEITNIVSIVKDFDFLNRLNHSSFESYTQYKLKIFTERKHVTDKGQHYNN